MSFWFSVIMFVYNNIPVYECFLYFWPHTVEVYVSTSEFPIIQDYDECNLTTTITHCHCDSFLTSSSCLYIPVGFCQWPLTLVFIKSHKVVGYSPCEDILTLFCHINSLPLYHGSLYYIVQYSSLNLVHWIHSSLNLVSEKPKQHLVNIVTQLSIHLHIPFVPLVHHLLFLHFAGKKE